MLSIEGEQTYPAAGGAHSGVLGAAVAPAQGMIAFVDDGTARLRRPKRDNVSCECSASARGCSSRTTCSVAVPW